jgi:hypothetical protein
MAFPHGCALLPFNAFPGLTLGEHANGPRAHSVAIQGFEFEYRALEALAQGNSTGQIVGEAIKNRMGMAFVKNLNLGGRQGEVRLCPRKARSGLCASDYVGPLPARTGPSAAPVAGTARDRAPGVRAHISPGSDVLSFGAIPACGLGRDKMPVARAPATCKKFGMETRSRWEPSGQSWMDRRRSTG